jgi:ubiquilin
MLLDPEMMRQALQMARNPGYAREVHRQVDRAMSNVENHPSGRGFDMLRRMHTEVQEPLLEATQQQAQQAAANPFAALFDGVAGADASAGADTSAGAAATSGEDSSSSSSSSSAAPNDAPLPNPWAPAGAGGGAVGASDAGGAVGTGGAPTPAGLGGMGAMLNNPAMHQMMQSMLSNPEALRS